MQRMTSARFVFLALIVVVSAGCGEDKAPKEGAIAGERNVPAASVDSAPATSHNSPRPTYGNENELLDSLASRDRATVLAFYESYGESIIDFNGAEQLSWLTANKYPMPDDVLAASRATEDELLVDYQQGDIQAGFFYLDRVAARLAAGNMDERERRHLDGVAREFLTSGSPLAGYAYYNYQRKVHLDLHAAFAGLVFAGDLGDGRASLEMMNQAYPGYAKDPASLDPMKLLGAYRRVLSIVRSKNPNLLTRKWPPFPPVKPKI